MSCGGRWRERDECGIGGGVNCADARSLASAWRGAFRQIPMSGEQAWRAGEEPWGPDMCGAARFVGGSQFRAHQLGEE